MMGDVVLLVFLYPQFVIAVKRGHDRNIATWVIVACYAVIAVPMGSISLVCSRCESI